MTSARLAAARALISIEAGATTLAAEVESGRAGLDDRRDRGLLLDLVAGTLRWRNALDAAISQVSARPLDDLEPVTRAVLRLGAYQLRQHDRIPPHAVVHESVETVKTFRATRAAGFVNAVLRSLIRKGPSITLPARPASADDRAGAVAYLSVTLSHPAWLVERWLDRYGFDATEAWCTFNNAPPEITARAAPGESFESLKVDLIAAGIDPKTPAFVPEMFRFAPGVLGRMPESLRDRLRVQEEGSGLVARAVAARPGDRVLDLCAAPGSKTLVLAEDLAGQGLLVACDVRPSRLRLLRATVAPLAEPLPGGPEGAPGPPRIVRLDASKPLPFGPVFDRVLVDAPCSGLGTLRRDPDLKWSRTAADLSRFADLQTTMLERAADAVKPGGVLVYATCSSEPEENAGVVQRFLAGDSRFHQVPVEAAHLPRDRAGALETRPDVHGLDAFYSAVLATRAAT